VCDIELDSDHRAVRVLGGKPRCERCGARMLADWTSGPLASLPEGALDELIDAIVSIPDDVELDDF